MIDLLTAPAMATPEKFTTFAEVVQTTGLINTAKALGMSPRTVPGRVAKPETFTLPELLLLAQLSETELGDLVTELAKQVAASEQPGTQRGARTNTVAVENNTLIVRVKT